MLPHEKAELIKKLPSMHTWEREEVEDKLEKIGELGPFYSGFISYCDDPVKEAIEIYTDCLNGWETELKRKTPIRPKSEIKQTIWRIKVILSNLKNESRPQN